MKKLLVLTFILLLAIGAWAQRPPMYFFFGGPNPDDSVYVGIDRWIDLEIWWQAGENDPPVQGADINLPLGINNCYVDEMDTLGGVLHFPFNLWDIAYFTGWNPDWMTDGNGCTWDSYSLQGFVDNGVQPYNTNYMEALTPQLGVTFHIHTINDATLIGTLVPDAIGVGFDPVQGGPNCGDPVGGAGYECISTILPFYFSPNQPPTIELLFQPSDICTYEDFSLPFDVVDVDGDAVDVTSTLGVPVLVGQEPEGEEGIRYHYELQFNAADFCGECASGDIVITANDNNNDPVMAEGGSVTFIGVLTASMDDALYLLPGEEDWMPVYLDVCGDCFCLGGFVFSIEWDVSVLTVTDFEWAPVFLNGDYRHVTYDIAGPGTMRVIFINNLNDQDPNPEICGLFDSWIFRFMIRLSPAYEYPDDFCIPVCFMYDADGEDHFDFNNVSDPGGYTVWMNDGCDDPPDSAEYATLELDMECGNVKILNEHNVLVGDLNMNGFAFEVGDAVLLANHLANPAGYPFNFRQMWASDVNGDNYQASIADLIFMINVLNNGGGAGKIVPLDVAATVAMPNATVGDMEVTVTSDVNVGGALVEINHAGVELGVPTAEGMDIQYSDNGSVMTVLVYNMDAVSFAPGTNVLFTVPVQGEGAISFGNVSVADSRGALLDARGEVAAPIPTEFSVSQNYPNPFNAKTSIGFGLPTAANVTINIYNVAGQLVETMNLGHLNAGTHSVIWDASDVASGVYFYKVAADNFNQTLKMTLLK